jgi:ferrous iron transport protein A
MTTNLVQLDTIPPKKEAIVQQIIGGHGLQQKLQVMGIRKGQHIIMSSKQPFRGPITIKVNEREITLGRGMAKKILVEMIS